MSDHKKVVFSSIAPIEKNKKRMKKDLNIRLSITLPESNEKSCPEFNYGDLLTQHLQRRLEEKRNGDVIDGKPPLEAGDPCASDEDEALQALARQFEKKYGKINPKSGKRRKKRKENDLQQLGEGYDESDPFIDNSAVVDDVVPKNMETKHRGFYINSGELDFEEVDVVSEDERTNDSDIEIGNKRKRNLIVSDNDSDSEAEDTSSSHTKKRKLDEGELLRRRKKRIHKFNKLKMKKTGSEGEATSPGVISQPTEKTEEEKPSPAVDTSIWASIEAVVSKAREAVSQEESSASSASSSSISSSESSSSDSETDKESDNEESNKEEVWNPDAANSNHSDSEKENRLPNDLPQDLLNDLDKIKVIGMNSRGSSQKFFTDAVNQLVLSIEIKLNKFGGRKKTIIYNHLSQHVPCGPQTLVKRGKNLLSEFLAKRLKEPTQRFVLRYGEPVLLMGI